MKKWDIIIIAILIILSFIPEAVLYISNNKYNSLYLEVYSEGTLYKKIPLDKDADKTCFTVKSSLGFNTIDIDKGEVKVVDADCTDKICAKSSSINKPGESIICLPHKLVVKITGEGDKETDDTSY